MDSTSYIQRLVVSNFSDYYIQIVQATYSTTVDVPTIIMEQDYFQPALESWEWDLSMGFVDDPLIRGSKPVLPVIRPIERILSRIKKVSAGDFSADPAIEWDNEFGDIGRGINELSGSVKNLIDTRIEIENEKREYEYRMLQSQINPHFLYNTLNSIKWMASIQNATGIPEMTTALSRLLKSIAKDSRQRVPIQAELAFLDDYYTIQKYRYVGSITMEVTVDEEALLRRTGIKRFIGGYKKHV